MDFSLVKRLFIPQGEVTKITNLEGITLWQKISRVLKEWRGLSPLTCTPTVAGEFEEVKVYGNSKQQQLPDGYTQLGYIEGTGTQYIDTGVKFNITHSYDLKFNTLSQSSANIFGGRTRVTAGLPDNDSLAIFANVSGRSTMYIDYDTRYTKTINANTDVEITITPTEIIVDGVSTPTGARKTVNGIYKICLFGINTGGTATIGEARFYSFKIRDEQNKTIQNLIPARRNSDNVIGMYDTVSNTFLTNAGTGEFVAGDVAPTPDNPIEIESVGDRTSNFFDETNYIANTILSTSTGLEAVNTSYRCSDFIPIKSNVKYTTGVTNTAGSGTFTYKIWTYDENKQPLSLMFSQTVSGTGTSYTLNFTTDTNAKYIRVSWRTSHNNIFVSEGDVSTYEPYGYKVPVTVSGKNLFDKNGEITNWYPNNKMIANSYANETFAIKHIAGTKYYFKHCNGDGGGRCFYTTVENPTIGSECSNPVGQTVVQKNDVISVISIPDDAKLVFFIFGRASATATMQEQTNDFMITTTPIDENTPYQPYVAPTTTNIYLPEPLRKIGEYADTLSVDGTDVTVVRNVGNTVFNGSENWQLYVNQPFDDERYYVANRQMYANNSIPYSKIKASFIYQSSASGVAKGNIYFGGSNINLICNIMTLEELINYFSKNNQSIIYPLATPTTETYTIEQPIMALDNTSIIAVDTTTPPTEVYASEYVEE